MVADAGCTCAYECESEVAMASSAVAVMTAVMPVSSAIGGAAIAVWSWSGDGADAPVGDRATGRMGS